MTIAMAAALSAAAACGFLLQITLLGRIHSASKAVRLFQIAALLMALGMLLSAARYVVWPSFAIIVGNTLGLTGLALLYPASRALLGLRRTWVAPIAVTVAVGTLVWFTVFTLEYANYQLRMAWVAALWCSSSIAGAILFARYREAGLGTATRATAVAIGCVAIVSALWLTRIPSLEVVPPAPDAALPGTMLIPVLSNVALLLSITVIVTFIVTTRAKHELIDARNQAEQANRRLMEMSWSDQRTGVATRARISHVLSHAISNQKASQSPLSAILVAVDSVDHVVAKLGHRAGDEALFEVAGIMCQVLGVESFPLDTVGRWGHSEFLAILPDTSPDDACSRAEWIRYHVLQIDDDPQRPVSCSIGVAEVTDIDTEIDVLARLDLALYRAKDRGPNRIEVG
jgi:diguanylate cyclase (GGDEF)-like protein